MSVRFCPYLLLPSMAYDSQDPHSAPVHASLIVLVFRSCAGSQATVEGRQGPGRTRPEMTSSLSALVNASTTLHNGSGVLANETEGCVFSTADGSGSADYEGVATGYVVMGTLLVIGASFVSCFGINLQKLAHNKNLEVDPEDRKKTLCQWQWWLGIICMILGSIMDMAALPFVPLSRVAALGCTTMVANIVITPLFLKEELTRHDLWGCVFAVIGTVLACLFGAGEEREVSSDCLLQYFTAPLFNVYLTVVMLFLAGCYYMIYTFKKLENALWEKNFLDEPLECVWLHKNLYLLEKVELPSYCKVVTSLGPQLYPSIHAMYGGIWGAQSVMFAKTVLKFLGNAIYNDDDNNGTGHSVLFLFIFLVPTGLCLYNQMHYLNRSLQIYRDALFVLPVYQAFWVAVGILSGLFFYQEYREIRHFHAVMFSVGCAFAIAGLIILSKRESTTPAIESPIKRRNSPEFMSAHGDSIEVQTELQLPSGDGPDVGLLGSSGRRGHPLSPATTGKGDWPNGSGRPASPLSPATRRESLLTREATGNSPVDAEQSSKSLAEYTQMAL